MNDPVPRIDQLDPDLVHAFYDRVYDDQVQRKAAREAAARKHRRDALQALAIVVLFVLLLALAGGIERTGW